MKTPTPGNIGLYPIEGVLGFFVAFGQLINGDTSKYTHAFLVLDNDEVVEAEPGGARIRPLTEYEGKDILFSNLPLTDEQRAAAVKYGREMVGTPYSGLDYLSLALYRLGLRPKWLKNYIKSKGHMICSQLVDYILCKSGYHLFNDGRMSEDITPGQIANKLVDNNLIL